MSRFASFAECTPLARGTRTNHEHITFPPIELDIEVHGPTQYPIGQSYTPTEDRHPPCQDVDQIRTDENGHPDHLADHCDACAYLPLTRTDDVFTRLVQYEDFTATVRVNELNMNLAKCFARYHLNIDYGLDIDMNVVGPQTDLTSLQRGAHIGLSRIVAELAPVLKDKEVWVRISDPYMRRHPDQYQIQLKTLSVLRCARLVLRETPAHSRTVAQAVITEVTSRTEAVDLIRPCLVAAAQPFLHENSLAAIRTRMENAALARDIPLFRRLQQELRQTFIAQARTVVTALSEHVLGPIFTPTNL